MGGGGSGGWPTNTETLSSSARALPSGENRDDEAKGNSRASVTVAGTPYRSGTPLARRCHPCVDSPILVAFLPTTALAGAWNVVCKAVRREFENDLGKSVSMRESLASA